MSKLRSYIIGFGIGIIAGVIQGYALHGLEAERATQLNREYARIASQCCASAERAVLSTKRCIDRTLSLRYQSDIDY